MQFVRPVSEPFTDRPELTGDGQGPACPLLSAPKAVEELLDCVAPGCAQTAKISAIKTEPTPRYFLMTFDPDIWAHIGTNLKPAPQFGWARLMKSIFEY